MRSGYLLAATENGKVRARRNAEWNSRRRNSRASGRILYFDTLIREVNYEKLNAFPRGTTTMEAAASGGERNGKEKLSSL